MAPAYGQISFSYGATEVVVSVPEFGYQTEIYLPFDFLNLDNGTVGSRDEGTKFDKRTCRCLAYLTPDEQSALNTLVNTTARGKELLLTLPSDSGFFPFGADKGDTGVFTVVLEFDGTPKIQMSPFKYFICPMIIKNIGAYPAYALPSEIAEGSFQIGTVQNLRMPSGLFDPIQEYAVSVAIMSGNRAEFVDKGSARDNASCKFTQQCNESKCAALLYYLTTTIRIAPFNIITPSNFYLFGRDHGGSDTYSVKTISNRLVTRCNRYNEFDIDLDLQRIS